MTGSVEVDVLTRALENLEWHRAGGVPGLYQVWSDLEGRNEIIVPLDDSKSDFEFLANRALNQVRRVSGVAIDLTALPHDGALEQLTIRSGSDSTTAIPSPEIVQMEDPFLGLLATAAKVSWVRRGFDAGSGEFVAHQVLEKVRIERGSLWTGSLAIQLPSRASFGVPDSKLITGEPAEEVSALRVMDTLEMCLSAAAHLAHEPSDPGRLEQIVDAVDPRIAYELASALARFLRVGRGVVVIERARPHSHLGKNRFDLLLDERVARVLDKEVSRLLPATGRRDMVLVGEVIPVQLADAGVDLVVVLDVLEGELRRAYLRLSPEAYQSTVLAYREGFLVRAQGEILRDGGRLWMHLPTVEVLDRLVPADDIPVRESGSHWKSDGPFGA